MTIIRAARQEEIRDTAKGIGWSYYEDSNGILIETENGGIGAMVIYDRWTNTAVEMHAYSTAPKYVFNPAFLYAMFSYPFEEQGKKLAFAVTPCDNTASVTLARFLGFKEVYRIRDGWDLGTDMVIQELRCEDCRFLENRSYGQCH